MMANKHIPEIRFKGFGDEWEEKKLGEIGKTFSGTGFPEKEQGGIEGIPFFKVSDMNNIGNEYEMQFSNNYVDLEQIKRKKWTPLEKLPAIIFAKVGAAIMLDRKRMILSKCLFDNNTMVYSFDESWNKNFAKTLFETIYLPKYAQIGALPSYNGSDIENIVINVPSKSEQQNIGTFFKQLDDSIDRRQQELDHLKQTKQAFLQKMFPKEGQTVPEVRFKGFDGEWEKKKIKDFTEFVSKGTTPKDKSGKGTVNFIKIENIENGQIINTSKIYEEEHESQLKRSILKVNDILFSIAGTLGRVCVVPESILPANTNQALAIIRGYKINKDFFLTVLSSRIVREFIKKNPTVGAQPNISLEQLKNIQLIIPTKIEEQQKIGTFFKQLDDRIQLHERELEGLKQTKQAFLQKMFV